jgi:multidrug efflux pump subunit AcrA (membrane-fusion protein)
MAKVGGVFDARRLLLLVRGEEASWRVHGQWPDEATDQAGDALRALSFADQAIEASPALAEPDPRSGRGAGLAVRLPDAALAPNQQAVLIIFLKGVEAVDAGLLSSLADLVVAIPAYYAQSRVSSAQSAGTAPSAQAAAERLYDVIQLAIGLGGETRFMRAALRLANTVAVRFSCDRAAVGWVDNRYVKLTAVSHVEKFDRRATAARDLESAMEEVLDQNLTVHWPGGTDPRVVTRAHETYARSQGSGHLLSVPLSIEGVPVAVMSLERRSAAFTDAEIWELRLLGEACARQLDALRRSDRWLGARLFSRLAAWRDVVLGPSYTAWKLAGVASVALVAVLSLLPWPYRIEAAVALRSQDIIFMPAPFDGYLRQAHIEVGDTVKAGALLVELDTRELVLEEAMAAADAARYTREAEKAQAARQLADMQIAIAREQQAISKLELIRHQLAHARLRAPFAGVVVEGELKKNIGTAVRKGDLLVKLAHTGETYVELEIDQADIHELSVGSRGEFAFVGRPDLRYPLVIERIDPAATMREGRNLYLARARFEAAYQPWWRPGMGGSARIDAGERSLLWILTYRTVRYLRQVFWI